MSTNIHPIERTIRTVAGFIIMALGLVALSWWAVLGAVMWLTGMSGWCPPYAMLGINTCNIGKNKSDNKSMPGHGKAA